MEKKQEMKHGRSFIRKTASKAISWVLIMAILVTFPKTLPSYVGSVSAAGNDLNVTLHFDNSGKNYAIPAIQYWNGTMDVTTVSENGIISVSGNEIEGWGGAIGYNLSQEETGNFYGVTLTGAPGSEFGFQFLDFAVPSNSPTSGSIFESTILEFTESTPTDLYFLYKDNTYGWYMDAAGTTKMKAAEKVNINFYFQSGIWTSPTLYQWNGKLEFSGGKGTDPLWGSNTNVFSDAVDGFHFLNMKGTINGFLFVDADGSAQTDNVSNDDIALLNKFIGETPTDVYILNKDGKWGLYMDKDGNKSLAETKEVSKGVNVTKKGMLEFTTVLDDTTGVNSVQLVYGLKDKVLESSSNVKTVDMSAGVNNSYVSPAIFFGDAETDVFYYFKINGVAAEMTDAETVNGLEGAVYHKAVFAGRNVYVPGTLPGPSWDPGTNQMTYVGNGLYILEVKDLIPANYQYKVAMGDWSENYGTNGVFDGSNVMMTVTETQDVQIYYSDFSNQIRNSINYIYGANVKLEGTGIPEGTTLVDERLMGIYSVTIPMTVGTYADTTITYDEEIYDFMEYEVKEAKDVTFYFDPSTELYYNDASDVKVSTNNIYFNSKDEAYKSNYGAVETGATTTFSITTGSDATAVKLFVKGKEKKNIDLVSVSDNSVVDVSGNSIGTKTWSGDVKIDTLGEYEYFFAIYAGGSLVVYGDDDSFYGEGKACDLLELQPYDLIVYQSGFETPDWMKNAVIYQIFPERFFDGDVSNNREQISARGAEDYEYVTDWYMLPENPEQETLHPDTYPSNAYLGDGNWSNEIYGGDLKGIADRIEYLKALGVNVIYLNPVFHSISSHRYDTSDYMNIDPILGTEGDFEKLVQVADENGMHVVLDGVFNHVADDSVYFDRYYKFLDELKDSKAETKAMGAYPYWAYVFDKMNEEDMTEADAKLAATAYFTENYGINDFTYVDWFDFNGADAFTVGDDGEPVCDTVGQRVGKEVYSYDCWWGYDSMPVVIATNGSEYQTKGFAEKIIGTNETSKTSDGSVAQYWLEKGMDGWRLDVANEVSDETWQHFRKSVKALDNDNVIIGEIWTDAVEYLMGDMYDSVMNYMFRGAVLAYTRDGGTSKAYIDTLEKLRERYPEEAFYAMMNLVSSHDTTRILSYLDGINDDRNQKEIEDAFPSYEATSDIAKQKQYLVAFLQFTYPGAPTIYYGDEIGMVGADDPDDRRAMTWGVGNKELVEWYATLGNIHNTYSTLRTGTVDPVDAGNDAVVAYVRSDEAATMLVLANNATKATEVTVDLDGKNVADGAYTDLISGSNVTVENGKVTLTVPALSGIILAKEADVQAVNVNYEALKPAYDSSYIVKDAKVTISKDTLSLTVGDSENITATGRDTITWTTSDAKVATVTNGAVKAIAAGSAVITASQADGQSVTCQVVVANKGEQKPVIVAATGVTLNETDITIAKGKTVTLTAAVAPSNTTDKTVTYATSNKEIATVDATGKVTGVKVGSAVITVTTSNGKTATCKVTVEIPATKVVMSSKTRVAVGKSKTLYTTITPSDSTDKVTFKSSNKKIVTVNAKGKITGKKVGKAKITAKTSSGKTKVCTVTVVKKAVKSTSVKLNKKSYSLKVGKIYQLKATMKPGKTTDVVKFTSSKANVAKVDNNGFVTALKKGTTTITAKTSNGKKATCKITVK